MAILNVVTYPTGLVGVNPSIAYIDTNDTIANILVTGYLNKAVQDGFVFNESMMACVATQPTVNSTTVQPIWMNIVKSGTNWSFAYPQGPMVVPITTASATPGTLRALTGSVTDTATTITSGNLVGVRGVVNYVGASGGFMYGTQGKLIPTGTLSGSSWNAGVFGQLDISQATINSGQTAPIWADMGATSGTITSATGMRMFAGTNTTAATLFAMDYRYGKATNLLELDGSSSTYISAGGATASGTIKKIAISIDGVTYYLQAATVYS